MYRIAQNHLRLSKERKNLAFKKGKTDDIEIEIDFKENK